MFVHIKIELRHYLLLTFVCAYHFTEFIVTSVLIYSMHVCVHAQQSKDNILCLVAKRLGFGSLLLTVGQEP